MTRDKGTISLRTAEVDQNKISLENAILHYFSEVNRNYVTCDVREQGGDFLIAGFHCFTGGYVLGIGRLQCVSHGCKEAIHSWDTRIRKITTLFGTFFTRSVISLVSTNQKTKLNLIYSSCDINFESNVILRVIYMEAYGSGQKDSECHNPKNVLLRCAISTDHRCEDGHFPVSASSVTASDPNLLSSSETGVNPGIRS